MSEQAVPQPTTPLTPKPTFARSQRRRYQSSLGRLVVSEFRKIFALRSTYWTLGTFCTLSLLGVYLSVLAFGTFIEATSSDADTQAELRDAVSAASPSNTLPVETLWMTLGNLTLFMSVVACIFAILNVSGEFSTGLMRQTLLSSPIRYRVYLAKMIVVAVATWVVSTLAIFIAWGITAGLSSSWHLEQLSQDRWGVPYVILFGVPASIVCLALFAFAVAMLTKSTAGAVCIVIGIFYVLPSALSLVYVFIPEQFHNISLDYFLPYNAALFFIGMNTNIIDNVAVFPNWWQCGIIVLLWAIVSNIAGYARFAKTNVQ